MQIKEEVRVCVNCGSHSTYSIEDFYKCNECGFKLSIADYFRVWRWSRDAALFGYLHRGAYEKLISEGRHEVRNYIPLQDILVFCAMAAISGIIGNRSDHLIVATIRKILRDKDHTNDRLYYPNQLLNNDRQEENIKNFIRYVFDYHQSLSFVDDEIRKRVLEEISVEILTEDFIAFQSTLRPYSKEALEVVKERSRSRVKRIQEGFEIKENLNLDFKFEDN